MKRTATSRRLIFGGPERYCPTCGTARGFHHVPGFKCARAEKPLVRREEK